jgi:hypothetical protein
MLASEFGWRHGDILSLTVRQFYLYLSQIEKLEARRNLVSCSISAFPHVDNASRRTQIQRYQSVFKTTNVTNQSKIDQNWDALKEMRKHNAGRRNHYRKAST